ncbi:MAG: zinc-ribbon domain-containing protein, partial [Methanomassiliicoccales archaeon]
MSDKRHGNQMNNEVCPVCDSKLKAGEKVCEVCGADLGLLGNNGEAGIVCPECGNELLDADTACPKCGTPLHVSEVVVFQCPACGTEVTEDATKCPNCGVEFMTEEEIASASQAPAMVESVPSPPAEFIAEEKPPEPST